MRTYTELCSLDTLEDRFEYLVLRGGVADSTFGYDRYINQQFYHSREWRRIRSFVIMRDNGWDLGVPDFPMRGAPQIHHMNPLTIEDFDEATENLLDPEFLISASHRTHNAIHYGDQSQLPRGLVERVSGDTRPW